MIKYPKTFKIEATLRGPSWGTTEDVIKILRRYCPVLVVEKVTEVTDGI